MKKERDRTDSEENTVKDEFFVSCGAPIKMYFLSSAPLDV